MAPYKDEKLRRERQREYSRRWYLSNKDRVRTAVRLRKKEQKERWDAYRAQHACSHCGFSHPAVIDFHHVIRTNKQSVNDLAVRQGNVNAAIREASEKCIPLCSNCHRILHWRERGGIKLERKEKVRREL